MIYSYKGERLAEHSYLVLRLYCGAFGSSHERLVARHLGAENLGVDAEPIAVAMRAACLLHDVGKALADYQERIMQGRGAPFHEVVSACLTYNALRFAPFDKGPLARRLLSFAAAYAVLQHHQAMRSFSEMLQEGLRYLRSLKGGINADVAVEVKLAAQMAEHLFDSERVLKGFERALERTLSGGLGVELQVFINDFSSTLEGRAPPGVGSDWSAAWTRLQPLLPLFAVPLQLCDYLAAYIARGGRMRPLHRETLLMLRKAQSDPSTSAYIPPNGGCRHARNPQRPNHRTK